MKPLENAKGISPPAAAISRWRSEPFRLFFPLGVFFSSAASRASELRACDPVGAGLGCFEPTGNRPSGHAESLIRSGCGAILDATFKASADRQLALSLANRHHMPVLFVECLVSEEEAIRRLERRGSAQNEVSDATPEVHRRQRAEFQPIHEIPPRNHLRLDTTRQRERLVAEIEDALDQLVPS